MKIYDQKKQTEHFKNQMLGQFSLNIFSITLLPGLPERVRRVRRVLQVRRVRQVFQVRRVLQVRQVFQVPEQVLVPVPQPSGVLPASALLPFCSQPLQMKMSRRKAGIE
jgi:hypothetical protein